MGDSLFPRIFGGLRVHDDYRSPSSLLAPEVGITDGTLGPLELQQYSFAVKYRRGRLNRIADALLRLLAVRAIRGPRCF